MNKLIVPFILALAVFFGNVQEAQARPKMKTILYAINLNWCGHIKRNCQAGREAFRVAGCETGWTFNVWAGRYKHQYWGLWQMGDSERQLFGHGWNAWDQAKAAHKYYVKSGRDWSPWSCRSAI